MNKRERPTAEGWPLAFVFMRTLDIIGIYFHNLSAGTFAVQLPAREITLLRSMPKAPKFTIATEEVDRNGALLKILFVE